MRGAMIGLAGGLLLAACGGGADGLRQFDTTAGPDEFSVQPARPLALPEALTLPQPGGGNRADPDPVSDAIAVLGGSPAAAFAGGIPASDQALVAQASRNGTDPGIRATLAAEDAALRSRAGLGGAFNILGRDRYFSTYANQALDAYTELDRFRALGISVPSAPPG